MLDTKTDDGFKITADSGWIAEKRRTCWQVGTSTSRSAAALQLWQLKPFDDQFDVGVDHCRYIYIYLFPIPIHPLPGDDQESVPGAAAGGRPGPGGEVATLFTLK